MGYRQPDLSINWTVAHVMLVTGHFRILGIGLELACNGGSCGGISLKRDECNLHLKRLPCISLTCKLVPVQYQEYENGLLDSTRHFACNVAMHFVE